jgi:hypothetical protein
MHAGIAQKKRIRPRVPESGKGGARLIKLLSWTNSLQAGAQGPQQGPQQVFISGGWPNKCLNWNEKQGKAEKEKLRHRLLIFFCVHRLLPLSKTGIGLFGIDRFALLVGQFFRGPASHLAVISNWLRDHNLVFIFIFIKYINRTQENSVSWRYRVRQGKPLRSSKSVFINS